MSIIALRTDCQAEARPVFIEIDSMRILQLTSSTECQLRRRGVRNNVAYALLGLYVEVQRGRILLRACVKT